GILSWKIDECKKGTSTDIFGCVKNEQIAQELLGDPQNGELHIAWDYNKEGSVLIDKQKILTIPIDGLWHEYKILLPGSGEYLKEFDIDYMSFPGTLEIKDTNFSYSK